MQNISDDFDFCRRCDGHGGHREKTDRGTSMFVPCDLCEGSGTKTVRVDDRKAGAA